VFPGHPDNSTTISIPESYPSHSDKSNTVPDGNTDKDRDGNTGIRSFIAEEQLETDLAVGFVTFAS